MITDLASRACAPRLPVRRQGFEVRPYRCLEVNIGLGREPAIALESRCNLGPKTGGEWRIDENDIEADRRRKLQHRQRIGATDLELSRIGTPLDQPFAQGRDRPRIDIDEANLGGAARQGLEAERATACKEIEHIAVRGKYLADVLADQIKELEM